MAKKKRRRKTRYTGIYELEDGRYEVVAAARHPISGKVVTRKRRTPSEATVGQAIDLREEVLQALHDELRGAGPSRLTQSESVEDYAVRWLEAKAERLRTRVAEHYEDILCNRILPVLGTIPVEQIRRADVERWVAWAERQVKPSGQHYARDTLRGWWRVVGNLLRDAAADYDSPDPMRRITPPRSSVRNVRERRTLEPEKLTRLLARVKALHPKWYAAAYFCATTGMRTGELRALRWEDIDRENNWIHVRHTISGGEEYPTKTDDPRDVILTENMRSTLDQHRRRMVEQQHRGLVSGRVFPGRRGGIQGSNSLRKILLLAAKEVGIDVKVGPQVLRRTFNTTMRNLGAPGEAVRAQMGHTTEEMTERYYQGHGAVIAAAVGQFEQLIGGESC